MAARADWDGLPLRQAEPHCLDVAPAGGRCHPDDDPAVRGDRHAPGGYNATAEALVFHHGIGSERKAARLRYLKERWATRLSARPRFQLHTSLDPALSCAIGTIGIEGIAPGEITSKFWEKWRIIATPIGHPEHQGVRVTPNVDTTIEEIDILADAMESIAKG